MGEVWNCSKEPNDCPYRFDYRGCIKVNCPFPYEYALKEASLFNQKWRRYTNLSGYDFTFVVNCKCFYAKEIFRGYGMACLPIAYEVYKISEDEYNNHVIFSELTSKEHIKSTGTNIDEDKYYMQFDLKG